MKKTYSKPEADKISFNYRDQVVAASAVTSGDGNFWDDLGGLIGNSMGSGSSVCNGLGQLFTWLDYC